MKGKHHIIIQNNKLRYEFDINPWRQRNWKNYTS